MKNKDILTKVLAITGTIFVWVPILFTILLSIIGTISARKFLFDFLMPLELFPIAFVGSLLLLWAALRVRSYQKLIGFGLIAALLFLIGSQAFAVITGLASGTTEPTGWPWILVISLIVLYSLALIEICIASILLLKKLFQNTSK